ncbi:MAG: hypothetical protein ACO3NW_06475 [Kiritimatiellia bacterium]
MSAWVSLTAEKVWDGLPVELQQIYADWIGEYPAKEGRLEALVEENVQLFRAAVEAHPFAVLDPEMDRIPLTGYHHAFYMVWNALALELGASMPSGLDVRVTRADIWLRMVQTGALNPVSSQTGSIPSYSESIHAERVLS